MYAVATNGNSIVRRKDNGGVNFEKTRVTCPSCGRR